MIAEPSSYASLNSQESTPQNHEFFWLASLQSPRWLGSFQSIGYEPRAQRRAILLPHDSQEPKASLKGSDFSKSRPGTRQRDLGVQQTVHWEYPGCWQSPGSSITSLWSFLPKSIRNGQKKACLEAVGSLFTWSSAPGTQLELSPFFRIKEGFSKRVVFNFKGCDLKNKKVYLLIQYWLPEGLMEEKKKMEKHPRPVSPGIKMLR